MNAGKFLIGKDIEQCLRLSEKRLKSDQIIKNFSKLFICRRERNWKRSEEKYG